MHELRRNNFQPCVECGVQEEVPTLGKPVLFMRETTECLEAVNTGAARLVGTDTQKIINEVQNLLENTSAYQAMSLAQNPYGNGTSSLQIANILKKELTA